MPRKASEYNIHAIAPGGGTYEQMYSVPVAFTVNGTWSRGAKIVGSAFDLSTGKIILNLYVKNPISGTKATHITYDSKDYDLSFYTEDGSA